MRKLGFLSFLFMLLLAACGTNDIDEDLIPESITISFNTQGGDALQNMTVNITDTSVNLPTPIREGFVFDGWYLNDELTEAFVQSVIADGNNITLYAKWTEGAATEYTVSFNTNGGNAIDAITVTASDTISPPIPERDGYVFSAWFIDEDLNFPFIETNGISEDLTLYAQWLEIYTVIFEAEGNVHHTAQITEGHDVSLPTTPVKEGYTFNGWFIDSALTDEAGFPHTINESMTFYAGFTINEYTLTFIVDGDVIDTIVADFDSPISAPADPVKDGYTFIGWFENIFLLDPYNFDTMPVNGATLTAKFEVNSYTIEFDTLGGPVVDDLTADFNTNISAPSEPTRDGYVFAGWYTTDTFEEQFAFATMPLDGATVYARWIEEENVHTVTFVMEDDMIEVTVFNGETVVVPFVEIPEGYVFVGWEDDFGTPFDDSEPITESVVVYIIIEPLLFNIYFNTIGPAMDAFSADYQSDIEAPVVPEFEGYIFAGWYEDEDYTIPFVWDTMPLGDFTIFMKWIADDEALSIFDVYAFNVDYGIFEDVYVTFSQFFPGEEPEDPGFYVVFITDGTASLVVMSEVGYDVGDRLDIEGFIEYDENIPMIYNIAEVTFIENDPTFEIPYIELSVEDFKDIDFNNPLHLGTFYIVTGFILADENFMFFDLVNELGYPMFNLLFDANLREDFEELEYFYARAGIISFREMDGFPLFFYAPEVLEAEVVPLTVFEKLDMLTDVLIELLESDVYYPGDPLFIPDEEPFFGATITMEAYGQNAQLYDDGEGVFDFVNEETLITFTLSISLDGFTYVNDVTITLSPFVATPIGELPDYLYMFTVIEGTVIALSEDSVWVQDETGIINLFGDIDTDVLIVGNRYLFEMNAYETDKDLFIIGNFMNAILLAEDELIDVLFTIDEETLLNIDDLHLTYKIEIQGVLEQFYGTNIPFKIITNFGTYYLNITNEALIDSLNDDLGELVTLEVLLKDYVGYFSPSGYIVTFLGAYSDILVEPFTDQMLLERVEVEFYDYLEQIFRLREYDLPMMTNIDSEVTFSYQIDSQYDAIATLSSDPTYTFTGLSEGSFMLEVTVSINDESHTFTVEITLEDYTVTSIADAELLPLGEVVSLQVTYAGNVYYSYIFATDDTGFVKFDWVINYPYGEYSWPMNGHQFVITGYYTLDESGDMYFKLIQYDEFIAEDQPMTLTPEAVSILDLLEPFDGTVRLIEVTGYLDWFGSDTGLYLNDEFNNDEAISLFVEPDIKGVLLDNYYQAEITVIGFLTEIPWSGETVIAFHAVVLNEIE